MGVRNAQLNRIGNTFALRLAHRMSYYVNERENAKRKRERQSEREEKRKRE